MAFKTSRKPNPSPEVHVGDSVELIFLPAEPAFGEVFHAGDRGTVTDIQPIPDLHERQIWVDWDNGHKLSLLEGIDLFKIVGGTK